MKTIKIPARYGYVHKLEHIGNNLWLFKTDPNSGKYYRLIGFEGVGKVKAYDPDGGPYLSVGSTINNYIIKSITTNGIFELEKIQNQNNMETVKYYYSKAIHVRFAPIVTDNQGDALYYLERNLRPARRLPRVTVASVYNKETDKMTFGVAICSPKDTFKKSEGRKLAYERAINNPDIIINKPEHNQIRRMSCDLANDLIDRAEHKFIKFIY